MFDVLGPSGPPGALRAPGTTGIDGVQDVQEFVRSTERKRVRGLQRPPRGPPREVGPRGPPGPRDDKGRSTI